MSQATTEQSPKSESTSEAGQQPAKRKRDSSPSPQRRIKKEKLENNSRKTKRDREGESSSLLSPEKIIKGKVQQADTAAFSTLPAELFDKICEYLPATDVLRMAATAKAFLHFGYAADRKKEEQRKVDDLTISLDVGSRAQLETLIKENHKLTALQEKILLAADEKATPLQKHLQRSTYAEILSGKMSLKQALEQIRRLETSLDANENSPLTKAWSYGLPHWQKTALDGGLPWLSLIYYPCDPTVDGFFTAEEMSGTGYTLLHAEIASSLQKDNPAMLSIRLDKVKTSSVAALLLTAFSTSGTTTASSLQYIRFVAALSRNYCVIAQAVLTVDPEILEGLTVPGYQYLEKRIKKAIAKNAISVTRVALSALTAAQRQALILGRGDVLSGAISQGHTQMTYLLLAGLNPTTPLTPQLGGWQQIISVLCIAADRGYIEMVRTLLPMLDIAHRQTAILMPQGSGPYQGKSALSIAEMSGQTALVAMMKDYLPAPEVETEVALTASSSQPSPVRFFTAPLAAAATEPRRSESVAPGVAQ